MTYEEGKVAAANIAKDIASNLGPEYQNDAAVGEIARIIIEDIWNGNWSSQTDFADPNLANIRIIEENEYDQSMDEDEKPEWETMLCDSSAGYVFPA